MINKKIPLLTIFSASLLVAGNLLGVGVLALPIKVGLSGFLPSVLDIMLIASIMLISAFVIASRLPAKKNFDIPSFFNQELGRFGYWIAVIANLILLYGVLVAYLSAISSILDNFLPKNINPALITLLYFLLVTSLIMFGRNILRRGNVILLIAVFITFIFLIKYGIKDFNAHLLNYVNWKYLPIGLPVAVSAFHFHNIIPTVSKYMQYDPAATRKAITMGVIIGIIINMIWIIVVLGSLLPMSGKESILHTFIHGLPATIPMTHLLHSRIFSLAGFIFAALAVTASYVANGTGLFGFIKDMTFTYFKIDNRLLIGILAFIPPLIITAIYPQIFLNAVDIVGGIGETILFMILPGFILLRIDSKKFSLLSALGGVLLIIGIFITLFITFQKLGLVYNF